MNPWQSLFALSVLCLGAASGCSLQEESECELHSMRCVNGVVEVCFESDTMTGSTGIWQQGPTCASAGHCMTDQKGAFCVLETTPEATCSATLDPPTAAGSEDKRCDDTRVVTCRSGYAVATEMCSTCYMELQAACRKGLGDGCDPKGTPCADGLVCNGFVCSAPCDCPPKQTCSACDAYGAHAGVQSRCGSGVCTWQDAQNNPAAHP